MKTFFKKRRFTLLTRPVKIFKSYKCFIFKYLDSNYENIRECKLSLTYIRKYKGECKSMKTRIFTFFMYSKNKKKHDLTFWLNFVMETEYNLISLKSWITWRLCCLLKFVVFFLLACARAHVFDMREKFGSTIFFCEYSGGFCQVPSTLFVNISYFTSKDENSSHPLTGEKTI